MWFLNKKLFETFLRTNNILNKSHLFDRCNCQLEIAVLGVQTKTILTNTQKNLLIGKIIHIMNC